MRKRGFWSLVCLSAVIVTAPGAQAQDNARTVPEAWLDSLEANLWRMEEPAAPAEYRLKETTLQLNADGSVKDAVVKYYQVRSANGKTASRTECDSLGQPVGKKPVAEKTETFGAEVDNPLAAVMKDQRANYSFERGDPDNSGHPQIIYRMRPDVKTGFNGTATIDTTLWAAVRIAGAPKPYPAKQIKEFRMDMEMEPADNGLLRVHKMTATMKGRYLVFSFYQRIVQEYSDYH